MWDSGGKVTECRGFLALGKLFGSAWPLLPLVQVVSSVLLLFWISLGGEPGGSGRTVIRLLPFFAADDVGCLHGGTQRTRLNYLPAVLAGVNQRRSPAAAAGLI